MATLAVQKDLVLSWKKETCLNLGILSKLHKLPSELSRQIFKENALEKPTQNLFNHLSHYLVAIVDPQASATLPWPLYDTKTERTYRNGFSNFVADYSSKGLLSPVMSSYLVNPSSSKVTNLLFQMSQLAVQRVLKPKMNRDYQKQLYEEMTEKYVENKIGFVEQIENKTEIMLSKFSNYLHKRATLEKAAEMLRTKITQMDEALAASKAKDLIEEFVDSFIKQNKPDAIFEEELLKIKNVDESSPFFDNWLNDVDEQISKMEMEWNSKVEPLLNISKMAQENTEALISRYTGEADKSSYMIEYNPQNDDICTKDLQNQVNSQQKYILKNIVKDDVLNFPNLVRGFLISISFILKGNEISDEIFKFNEYLNGGRRSFNEILFALRAVMDRVHDAEDKLQPSEPSFNSSIPKEFSTIPQLPDLSCLKTNKEFHNRIIFDTFTPLNTSRHQFNLRRKNSIQSFIKPQPKSLLTTFHQGPKDDFLKSIISCRISSYDHSNMTLNKSIKSLAPPRVNETIADCPSGFTKHQILRLLSTKKSSSSKKFKKFERPEIKVKKGGLFNESSTSNESNGLFRSYSSPNLFENREQKARRRRKLSIMQEDSPSLGNVSGIMALDRDSGRCTPVGVVNLESTRKLLDASSMPVITITPESDKNFAMFKELNVDLNKLIQNESTDTKSVYSVEKSKEISEIEAKPETPKTNTQLIKKTSSLEKIINRFKKVRAPAAHTIKYDDESEITTIVEEKENFNSVNIDVFTANRKLLPDLLSPSCNVLSFKSSEFLDDLSFEDSQGVKKRPRESLGTALGVDHTFLDQFDLID